jgi:hypothetical protein
MTDVKGTVLASMVRYLTETFGAPGLQKVLTDLTPEERTQVQSVLVSAWYPVPLLLKVMRAAHKHFAAQAPRLYTDMGRASSDYSVTGVYKIFFKMGSPEFIIAKAGSLYQKYYSTGAMQLVVVEKGHAVMDMVGFRDPAPELCDRISGWLGRTLELSGAQDVRLVHPQCANRGDAACRFEGWWS